MKRIDIYMCYDCGEEVVDLDPRHPYGYLVPDELAARYASSVLLNLLGVGWG